MKIFAIRHKASGKLLTFYTMSNGDGWETTIKEFSLGDTDQIWTGQIEEARNIIKYGDAWYNGISHCFHSDELEIVELEIHVTNVVV